MGLVDAKVSAPEKDAPGSAVGAAVPPRDPQAHSHASEAVTLSLDCLWQRSSGSSATHAHPALSGLPSLTQPGASTHPDAGAPDSTKCQSGLSTQAGYTGCGYSRTYTMRKARARDMTCANGGSGDFRRSPGPESGVFVGPGARSGPAGRAIHLS